MTGHVGYGKTPEFLPQGLQAPGRAGARRVAGSSAIDLLARLGFVARGIIYIIIGRPPSSG